MWTDVSLGALGIAIMITHHNASTTALVIALKFISVANEAVKFEVLCLDLGLTSWTPCLRAKSINGLYGPASSL